MMEAFFLSLLLFACGRCFGWCIKTGNPLILLVGVIFFTPPMFMLFEAGSIIPVIFGVIGMLSSWGFTVTGLVGGFFKLFKFKPKTRAKNHNTNENAE